MNDDRGGRDEQGEYGDGDAGFDEYAYRPPRRHSATMAQQDPHEGWTTERAEPQFVPGVDEHEVPPQGRRAARKAREARARKTKRRRWVGVGGVLAVLVVLCVGAYGALRLVFPGMFTPDPKDYSGNGLADVVVQVKDGDTTTDIASTLAQDNVVASTGAFLRAAKNNSGIATVQPGYYALRTEIPGKSAVQLLTSPAARVGQVVIPEGRQLSDVTTVSGHVTEGILTLIAHASCVPVDGGGPKCVSVDQLRGALAAADPRQIGVPTWAVDRVLKVHDPQRRFEGLIKAGTWNFDPTAAPEQILKTLFTASTAAYNEAGLPTAGADTGLSPYDTLVASSLVEREAHPADFAKVARVIVNRLKAGQQLQFDSTVNYLLDRVEVATTDKDRETPTPWNTYAMNGLPATPIAAPGDDALQAAEHPAPGDWLYFVTVDKTGTTLFTADYQQHLANIGLASKAGVLDSGR